MKTVQLLVTGQLERLALHHALQRLFPEAEFLEPQKLEGFTSVRIGPVAPPPAPRGVVRSESTVCKLARALLAAVEPGRRKAIPDLVVAVDDLELVNADQPERVTAHFRDAVTSVLAEYRGSSEVSRRRAEEGLRERCSFHLMAPMTEAYFFGEAAALERAGIRRPCRFPAAARDVEQFLVDDSDFLAAPDGSRHWARPDRRCHPKRYLQFLCTDPPQEGDTAEDIVGYRETDQGKRALQRLAWEEVLAHARFAPFARALLHDLAEGLGAATPAPGDCAPPTARRSGGVLRNL